MIILHVAPVVWKRVSGINACVPGLIAAQSGLGGVEVGLASTAAEPGNAAAPGFPVFARESLLGASGGIGLPAPFDRPDLVVFHSTYIPLQATLAARLRKATVPYLICPHGGMTRFAQAYKGWKKRIANLLFFRRMVAGAAALHCLTQGEADECRRWGRPVFVVGNGVSIPPSAQLASPGSSDHLRLVFIGRLMVRYKGLDLLLDACGLIRSLLRQRGVRVELYGPDERGSMRTLANRIAALRLGDVVSLGGSVVGEAKAQLLRRSDGLLLTSRSEGHPVAVLEALAFGLPCLLTPGTNVAGEIEAAGAGWQVEPSPAAIAAGLARLIRTDPHALQEAGTRARQLAVSQYTWEQIAARSVAEYRKCTDSESVVRGGFASPPDARWPTSPSDSTRGIPGDPVSRVHQQRPAA